VRDVRADSLDLRQKVVAAIVRADSTIEEVAATFGVGLTLITSLPSH
jgi:transposase